MMSLVRIAIALALVPVSAFAAQPSSFIIAQSPLATSSLRGNAYIGGASVVLTSPVEGDLSAAGGTVVSGAPVSGDTLLLGGSVSIRNSVGGDVRVAGGTITIGGPVQGDIVAFGYTVQTLERPAGSVFIGAANASITEGAGGPVKIYANNVTLAGTFAGDVSVTAASRIVLAPDTVIRGKLFYESPDLAEIPESVRIAEGIEYTSSSYFPGADASRALAVVSIGVFMLVRVLGALILAGLLAGLFPKPAERIVERLYSVRLHRSLLILALGFATIVATPVLIVLLALTFVGIGVAILLFVAYILLLLLALMYAGIVIGGLMARRLGGRSTILWHDGVLGMLLLSVISLVPVIGFPIVALLTTLSAGFLVRLFFRVLFLKERDETDDSQAA